MTRAQAELVAGLAQCACAIVAAIAAPPGWRVTVFFALACVSGYRVTPR